LGFTIQTFFLNLKKAHQDIKSCMVGLLMAGLAGWGAWRCFFLFRSFGSIPDERAVVVVVVVVVLHGGLVC
jgi:hypothetical protein